MEPERMELQSDQSLMAAVREGDVGQLGVLFERHSGHLYNYLFRLTGNRHLSEDLVQEVFVRMLKYRHTYRGESQFTTWMFQIARNARVDHFRRSPREETSLEDDKGHHVSLLPTPVQRAEAEEEMRILQDALDRLAPEKRELLLLRGFEGMKIEEIAKVMSCSVNTIKGRALRAIRELRVLVQDLTGERAS